MQDRYIVNENLLITLAQKVRAGVGYDHTLPNPRQSG